MTCRWCEEGHELLGRIHSVPMHGGMLIVACDRGEAPKPERKRGEHIELPSVDGLVPDEVLQAIVGEIKSGWVLQAEQLGDVAREILRRRRRDDPILDAALALDVRDWRQIEGRYKGGGHAPMRETTCVRLEALREALGQGSPCSCGNESIGVGLDGQPICEQCRVGGEDDPPDRSSRGATFRTKDGETITLLDYEERAGNAFDPADGRQRYLPGTIQARIYTRLLEVRWLTLPQVVKLFPIGPDADELHEVLDGMCKAGDLVEVGGLGRRTRWRLRTEDDEKGP